jgi:hypothetical protein
MPSKKEKLDRTKQLAKPEIFFTILQLPVLFDSSDLFILKRFFRGTVAMVNKRAKRKKLQPLHYLQVL